MEIKFICTTWGMKESSLKKKLKRIKKAGYDGVEMGAPVNERERTKAEKFLQKYKLLFVAQQWSEGETIEDHKKSMEEQVIINSDLNPVLINSHTGKDYFRFDENLELLRFAGELSAKYNVKIVHETHRGRFGFSALQTSEYLRELPDLELTADFSHWCCVSESLLHEQEHFLKNAISQSSHLHARIGYAQGPQVTDPRAPEWHTELKRHLEWWDDIIEMNRQKAANILTVTPEFGPVPYLHTLPFTNEAVADQWEINLYMMDMLKKRYE